MDIEKVEAGRIVEVHAGLGLDDALLAKGADAPVRIRIRGSDVEDSVDVVLLENKQILAEALQRRDALAIARADVGPLRAGRRIGAPAYHRCRQRTSDARPVQATRVGGITRHPHARNECLDETPCRRP